MEFSRLQRFFSLEASNVGELEGLVDDALQVALEFLRNPHARALHGESALPGLSRLFGHLPFPPGQDGLQEIWEKTKRQVMENAVQVSAPSYVGHMSSALPLFSLPLEMLIWAMNQNLVKMETALSASYVEGQTLAWLHEAVFARPEEFYRQVLHQPGVALGNFCSGGTMGNLTALAAARNTLLPECRSGGLAHALALRGASRAVVLVSKRGHYSLRKAVETLGLGAQSLLEIPVHPKTNLCDTRKLAERLEELQGTGAFVLAVVGVAGSTETGSVDPLDEMADLAKGRGAWFHVDAAWGGACLLSPQLRPWFAGIERADSVVLDAHKLFYLPLSQSAVLFGNERTVDSLRHYASYIVRKGSLDLGQTSLEGSRRFDALKLWVSLQVFGQQGYACLVDHSCTLAQKFTDLIAAHPSFEVTSVRQTNIVTYRYVPKAWRDLLGEDAPAEARQWAGEFLNKVNTEIQKNQRLRGQSFVSRTTLESVVLGQETVVLRAVLFNPLTTPEMLADILLEQETLGLSLAKQRWRKLRRPLPGGAREFPDLGAAATV